MTRRPLRPPGTSWGRSPPMIPMAITRSRAPRSWGNPAARSARSQWPWTGSGPRSSPRPPARRPAACRRPSPSHPRSARRPRKNTTTPPKNHRRSHARRTAAERTFATAKDPASNDTSRGWCQLTGLTAITLLTATLLAVRNQRILTAWAARQEQNAQRATAGLPPGTRRRRRKTPALLTAAPP